MKQLFLKIILPLSFLPTPLLVSAQDCPDGAEPEYWVAPMDPNFRRDKPGKSPMGMDLVPKCASSSEQANRISIDPQIVQNLGLRTETVRTAALRKSLPLFGEIQRDPARTQQLHAWTQGWIRGIGVSGEGDQVKAGQVLYTLYSREFYAAEAELLASLPNKTLRQAAESRLRALGYSDDQITAVKRRGKPSDELSVRAEKAGQITMLMIQPGQYVTPGTQLMQISDDSELWFVAQVEESRIDYLQRGDEASILIDALPQHSWSTRLEQIGTQLELPSRTLAARFVLDNADALLRAGMLGRADLALTASDETPLAPASAVIRDGRSARVVKALGQGEFEVSFVELGHYADGQWQILKGLQDGDQVVVKGQFLLDSEANVDAESMRLDPAMDDSDMQMEAAPTLTRAIIENQNKQKRWLTLAHDYIHSIDMPAMTMSFDVSEQIDMTPLQIGQEIYVLVENPEPGVFVISDIQDQP